MGLSSITYCVSEIATIRCGLRRTAKGRINGTVTITV